ncbi:hypothetical protein Metme_0107 [Methylomonas methanica MC09]|uniref:Uncharacterized protein n=2 Tax=Methylomonas methanica TaxID=421 RepID=F9ZXX8_METMM|nr:hypothetical protein Metme_0107 [Methylomonas methanica MC09]
MMEIKVVTHYFLEKSIDSGPFLNFFFLMENIRKRVFGPVKLYLFDIIWFAINAHLFVAGYTLILRSAAALKLMLYLYARVTTRDQIPTPGHETFKRAGCKAECPKIRFVTSNSRQTLPK